MPTAFDRAAAVISGNVDLSAAATLFPAGDLEAGTAVSVILSRADADSEFGESRVRGIQTIASILVAEAPGLAAGDLLRIGTETFRIAAAPDRDAARTTWSALLARVA